MSVTDDSGRVGESLEFGWQLIDPGRSVKIHAIFFSYVCPALMVESALLSADWRKVHWWILSLWTAQSKKTQWKRKLVCIYNPLKLSQLQKPSCGIAQTLWHRVIESWAGSCLLIGSTAAPLLVLLRSRQSRAETQPSRTKNAYICTNISVPWGFFFPLEMHLLGEHAAL